MSFPTFRGTLPKRAWYYIDRWMRDLYGRWYRADVFYQYAWQDEAIRAYERVSLSGLESQSTRALIWSRGQWKALDWARWYGPNVIVR